MSEAVLSQVVAALRDTADKTLKVEERKRTGYNHVPGGFGEQISVVETYPREWVAGRLLGMADMIEAITKASTPTDPTEPTNSQQSGH
ncbi:hypothetical protein [Microvirga alba]|uniref:Uncharacterized protein n=1 Tax=Microvirga alba TaxID=2791025 RepID=A0A931FPF3_9HYPH|nr:hypothetical protein [Microvirga alba]MBF9234695.1 hypothetical protein [Microvirga alba]